MKKRNNKSNKANARKQREHDRSTSSDSKGKPALSLEPLEQRILLSATWTGTAGDDFFAGTAMNDEAYGLDGNDEMHGAAPGEVTDDLLFGGGGDDLLYGERGKDVLDGGVGDDQLFGGRGNDTLISGGGNDFMAGEIGNDTFQFTGAQDGDTITVDGGLGGQDRIDVSSYNNSQITDDGSTLTVDMGGGQSFTVNYTNITDIETSDGTYLAGSVPSGSAPDAVDDAVSTNEDTAVTTGNVLTNDTDPDGDTLSVSSFTQGSNGTVVDNGDGTFTYTPKANFSGNDSFSYTVDDGNGNMDTATVNVTVGAVNDGPVADSGADLSVDELTQVTLDASASSDLDGDALTYTWTQTGGPAVNLSNASAAQPTFDAPDVGSATTLTFQVEVSDGQSTSIDTVDVVVNPVGSSPPPPPPPPPPNPPPPPPTPDAVVDAEPDLDPLVEPEVVEDELVEVLPEVLNDADPTADLASESESMVSEESVPMSEASTTTDSISEVETFVEPHADNEPSDAIQPVMTDTAGVSDEIPPAEASQAFVEVNELQDRDTGMDAEDEVETDRDQTTRDKSDSVPLVADARPAGAFDGEPDGGVFELGDTSGSNAGDVFEEVDLPDMADIGAATAPVMEDVAGGATDEVSQRVEDRHFEELEDDLEPGRRVIEDQAGDWNAYDPEGLSGDAGDGSMATSDVSGVTFGAFVAGLWGAIRGLGSTARRTGDNKDESD